MESHAFLIKKCPVKWGFTSWICGTFVTFLSYEIVEITWGSKIWSPEAYRISAQFQRCQILKAAEVKVLFFRCVSQSWGWVWVKMENSRPWGITTTDKDNRRHAFLAKADISSLIWESHLYFYNTDVIHKNIQWKSKGKSLLINLLLFCCSKFENTTY